MGKLNIGSVNCRGLSSCSVKRRDIFNRCRKNYDITFLIDSHCKKESERFWRSEWGYKAVFSSIASNSRGVVILFKNSFELEIHQEIIDPDGNFIIMDVTRFKKTK